MSKFKSECREGGERAILFSRDPGGRTGEKAFSQIHVAPRVRLMDGYGSLNHLVLNLMGAAGAEFDTEGSALWLFPCGPSDLQSKSPGALKLLVLL